MLITKINLRIEEKMLKYFITTFFCEFNIIYVSIFLYFYISYSSIVIIIKYLLL